MSEEKRCKDYCKITAAYSCCYECDKNQECDMYNVAKCNICEIHKEHNYRSITDKFGRITKVSKVKKKESDDNNTRKIMCHMTCEDMDNQPVCCYECKERNTCNNLNKCKDKCEDYIKYETIAIESKNKEKCSICKKRNECNNQHEYDCKAYNYRYYVKEKRDKDEKCYTCRKKESCHEYMEANCKASDYCYYLQERKDNKDIKIINKSDTSIETNKESIISVSTKATKLLKIECILRSCSIDDLIVNLISDKAKAIYDNVVDNK